MVPVRDGGETGASARNWLTVFLTTSAVCFFGAAAFIVAADPYDAGRFSLIKMRGLVDERAMFAAASRGRDPDFDAAVIGNSHAQLINPRRLSDLTGRHFVQLSMQGAPITAQEATARFFIEHHKGTPVAMLFVIDDFWCTPGPPPPGFPFPFWLYGDDDWSYLANVIGPDGLSKAVARVGLALGLKERTWRDGFDNVEEKYSNFWNAENFTATFTAAPPWASQDVGAPIPKVDKLRALIDRASPGSRFALLWTPYYVNALPAAGSPAEARLRECKQTYAALAAGRLDTAIVDWRVRSPLAENTGNFSDATHVRLVVAHMLEDAVAPALAR